MTQKRPMNNTRRPVLGWFSIGVGLSVFLFLVAIVGVPIRQALSEQTSASIIVVTGDVSAWVLYAIVATIAAGVILAVVGLVLGERRRWLHSVGVVLNIGAPAAAVATMRLLYDEEGSICEHNSELAFLFVVNRRQHQGIERVMLRVPAAARLEALGYGYG